MSHRPVMRLLCLALVLLGAVCSSRAQQSILPAQTSGFLGEKIVMFDSFNRPEGAGKSLGVSDSGHQWLIPVSGTWQTNGWTLQNGRVFSTNSAHQLVFGPYMSNRVDDAREWRMMGAAVRFRAGPSGIVGNQVISLVWSDNAEAFGNNVRISIDGPRVFVDRFENGIPLTNWCFALCSTLIDDTNIHLFQGSIISNSIIAQVDNQFYVTTETNLSGFTFPVSQWQFYGSSNATQLVEVESVWAGFPSEALYQRYGRGVGYYGGVTGARWTVNPTLTTNTYLADVTDQRVLMLGGGSATLLATNKITPYLMEFGREYFVMDGSGRAAGTNTWVMTPDGQKIIALGSGATTGPDRTNITKNYGWMLLEETPLGWMEKASSR